MWDYKLSIRANNITPKDLDAPRIKLPGQTQDFNRFRFNFIGAIAHAFNIATKAEFFIDSNKKPIVRYIYAKSFAKKADSQHLQGAVLSSALQKLYDHYHPRPAAPQPAPPQPGPQPAPQPTGAGAQPQPTPSKPITTGTTSTPVVSVGTTPTASSGAAAASNASIVLSDTETKQILEQFTIAIGDYINRTAPTNTQWRVDQNFFSEKICQEITEGSQKGVSHKRETNLRDEIRKALSEKPIGYYNNKYPRQNKYGLHHAVKDYRFKQFLATGVPMIAVKPPVTTTQTQPATSYTPLQASSKQLPDLGAKYRMDTDHLLVGGFFTLGGQQVGFGTFNIAHDDYNANFYLKGMPDPKTGRAITRDSNTQGLHGSDITKNDKKVQGDLTVRDQKIVQQIVETLTHPTHPKQFLALQEISPHVKQALEKALGPNYQIIQGEQGNDVGALIIEKSVFTLQNNPDHKKYVDPKSGKEQTNKYITDFTLMHKSGASIRVINTHALFQQTNQLADYISKNLPEDAPILLMGDMNATTNEVGKNLQAQLPANCKLQLITKGEVTHISGSKHAADYDQIWLITKAQDNTLQGVRSTQNPAELYQPLADPNSPYQRLIETTEVIRQALQ